MKIEKVNDNQIRCTLTREDLASRKIKLSELAYGTEKAKSLFRDMMQQANYEFGFEAEDIPLMIEAIPLNQDCIVLIITKVEDPEELDTRFSRFAPDLEDAVAEEMSQKAPEVPLDLFHQAAEAKEAKQETATDSAPANAPAPRVFSFPSIEGILDVSKLINSDYLGKSFLYKSASENTYLLQVFPDPECPGDFDRVCNLLSEYGSYCRSKKYDLAFLSEHCELLLGEYALARLGSPY